MRISDWSSDVCSSDLGVRINTDLAQLLDRVLRGLGLELARRSNEGHQGQVYESGIVAPQAQAHLPGGFQERQGFDIAHRAADLDDSHIGFAVPCRLGDARHEVLEFVGDMGDALYRLAQVIAAALLSQPGLVVLAGREVFYLW